MAVAVQWVFSIISGVVSWLNSWSYAGVPFLMWLIAIAVLGIVMRYIL